MTIPGFQDVMLPLLQWASDGQAHALRDAVSAMTTHLQLTDEEASEMLPRGNSTVIYNRVAWCSTYLRRAGLLEATQRG